MHNFTLIFCIKVNENHRNGQFKDLICFEDVLFFDMSFQGLI